MKPIPAKTNKQRTQYSVNPSYKKKSVSYIKKLTSPVKPAKFLANLSFIPIPSNTSSSKSNKCPKLRQFYHYRPIEIHKKSLYTILHGKMLAFLAFMVDRPGCFGAILRLALVCLGRWMLGHLLLGSAV